jgi:DNA topoisomerase I
MPRLRRSSCAAPGIVRRRRGHGFAYRDRDGGRIEDREVLERIAELAIPPAWREVWICTDPNGHLQATGVDAAGRKQYVYHERWQAHRDRLKFDSMLAFGEALPRLRRRVARDLGRDRDAEAARLAAKDLTRERVLACVVRLLDLGFFRIGSEDYAERNESFGLTTLLKEHVTVAGHELVFDFPSKSGQRRVQEIADEDARAVISALKRRRGGSQLFAYRTREGWAELHADDVNAYIKQHAGGTFSAKDFRTWNATVLAAVALAVSGPAASKSKTARKRACTRAVKEVAHYLGNTPAVCRRSYIDPRVFDRYADGFTIGGVLTDIGEEGDIESLHGSAEDAVLELIADPEESEAVEKVA